LSFNQLSTPLKILAILFGLGLAWIIYMAGFLTLSLPLSEQQLKNVNATKTAIAERWNMLLRPGFTHTPTITLTPSITPTPTRTPTVTVTPTNTSTPSRTPYYFPSRVAGTQAAATSGPAATLSIPSATPVVATQITPPATETPLPATPQPTLPLPTQPLPTTAIPPTIPPTEPPPTEPPPTEASTDNTEATSQWVVSFVKGNCVLI